MTSYRNLYSLLKRNILHFFFHLKVLEDYFDIFVIFIQVPLVLGIEKS